MPTINCGDLANDLPASGLNKSTFREPLAARTDALLAGLLKGNRGDPHELRCIELLSGVIANAIITKVMIHLTATVPLDSGVIVDRVLQTLTLNASDRVHNFDQFNTLVMARVAEICASSVGSEGICYPDSSHGVEIVAQHIASHVVYSAVQEIASFLGTDLDDLIDEAFARHDPDELVRLAGSLSGNFQETVLARANAMILEVFNHTDAKPHENAAVELAAAGVVDVAIRAGARQAYDAMVPKIEDLEDRAISLHIPDR